MLIPDDTGFADMRAVATSGPNKRSKTRMRWCIVLSTIGIAIIIGITYYIATNPQNVPMQGPRMQAIPEKVSIKGFQLLRYFFLEIYKYIRAPKGIYRIL